MKILTWGNYIIFGSTKRLTHSSDFQQTIQQDFKTKNLTPNNNNPCKHPQVVDYSCKWTFKILEAHINAPKMNLEVEGFEHEGLHYYFSPFNPTKQTKQTNLCQHNLPDS